MSVGRFGELRSLNFLFLPTSFGALGVGERGVAFGARLYSARESESESEAGRGNDRNSYIG
eukprot:1196196-Prorocentrum_minimum.AAC.5